jgi:Siphovirus ReqiPepy6 Gp37-like protein
MDLIKLSSNSAFLTELTEGEAVNGYESLLWVERYQKPGEFKIKAKLSSGLRDMLPIGTFLTHVKTREVMWVENHFVRELKDKDPMVEITGRSFVSYLEQRIIGQDWSEGNNDFPPYVVAAAPSWEQIVTTIFDQFISGGPFDDDNTIPGFVATESCVGTGTVVDRLFKYGTVWDKIEEVLHVDDVGIRILRSVTSDPDFEFNVYQGADRTSTARFSSATGDMDNIEYLFSRKKEKTKARVMGRWVQVNVSPGSEVNLDRRYMLVDASDIDQQFSAMPTGGDLTNVINAMTVRGQEALTQFKNITISRADISPNSRLRYRVDYELGDLVVVDANFNESQIMRVIEFAEVEDQDGTSGHPTLAIPGEI